MNSNFRCDRFLKHDERGSATIWSIFWTVVFLFLAGVAIDVSNAYRFKSALQATADASSLGGMRAYKHEQSYQGYTGDTVVQTEDYRGTQVASALAAVNMRGSHNGTVVPVSNITFGRWDGSAFDPTGTPVNATSVVAVRTDGNSNELPTFILGRFGLQSSWDVGATSVTEAFFSDCPSQEGLMAGGGLQIASNNLFQGNLCLHGEEYIDLNNNNEFYANAAGNLPELSFGVPGAVCSGFDDCQTEGFTNVTVNNVNLTESMIDGPAIRMPDVPGMIDDIQTVIANPAAYAGESDGRNHYIPKNLVTNPDRTTGATAILETPVLPPSSDLPPGVTASIVNGVVRIPMSKTQFQTAVENAGTTPLPTNAIYEVTSGCTSGNRRLDLDDAVTIRDIVLVTSCRVSFSNNISFLNSTLLTTYDGVNDAIHGSSGVNLGGGTCADATDGSLFVATDADVNFAASLTMSNSQIIAGTDVDIAAQPSGMEGVTILAANDIRVTSGGEWRGCPNTSDAEPVVAFSYRLVY